MVKMGDISRILEDHEKRLSKIEETIFSKKVKVQKFPKNYSGLSGGIELLIDDGFFDTPKSTREIQGELKREGYHYSFTSVSKMLSIDFIQKRRVLRGLKEGGIWRYVLRK